MDPNKRGNPPYEPSSHAAGMQRRIKRMEDWMAAAREMAKDLIDGDPIDQMVAKGWWRQQLDMPAVVLSREDLLRAVAQSDDAALRPT